MNKKSKAAETTLKSKPVKSKQTTENSGTKSAKTKTAKTKAAKTPEFDFVGKVESIRVQTASGQPPFTFGLKGRNGVRRSFQLTAADSFALNIMAAIVTAAHASDVKVGVRVGAADEVVEVQSRPRLGKNG